MTFAMVFALMLFFTENVMGFLASKTLRIATISPLYSEPVYREFEDPDIKYLTGLRWTLSGGNDQPATSEADVYPLFPMGDVVYLPETEHTLNIFEPRYRAMYRDIMTNGKRSFVVAQMNENGMAEFGSLLRVTELEDVSIQTNDKVKYVAKHIVVRRVRLRKVLNPNVFKMGTTYVKVEVEDQVESKPANIDEYEDEVRRLCRDLKLVIELQNELNIPTRFQGNIDRAFPASSLGPTALGSGKLWELAALWQELARAKLSSEVTKANEDLQLVLVNYFTKNGAVSLNELKGKDLTIPPLLKAKVEKLQKKAEGKLKMLKDDTSYPYQQLLQAEGPFARLRLLRRVIYAEWQDLEMEKRKRASSP